MDQGFSAAVSELSKLGLPGIVILGLGLAVIRLFKLYAGAQEKRISEGRETLKAIEANTSSLEGLVSLLRDRGRA